MADADDVMRAIYTALRHELVRATIRIQMRSIPRSMLLKLLGVNGKQFRHFMNGGAPAGQLWGAGRAFEEGMTGPVEIQLESIGLNIIADTFPNWHRARVRQALADAIRPVLRAEGREMETL